MSAQRWMVPVGFVAALVLCTSARALEDVPISFSNTYGAFSVKWVNDATTGNRVQQAAQRSSQRTQKKLAKSLKSLAKKPDLSKLEKIKKQLEAALAKGAGQSSLLVWASVIETVGLNPQVGMTGTMSFGDAGSGGFQGAFTLSQEYHGTVQGHAITAFYTTPPTATDATYTFHALILSDELSALTGAGTVGVWVSAVCDPSLLVALGQFGVTNTTTAQEGVALNLSASLAFDGTPAHKGTASFSDTYFSVQDLIGVGVPPQVVEAAKAYYAKLQAKMAAAK